MQPTNPSSHNSPVRSRRNNKRVAAWIAGIFLGIWLMIGAGVLGAWLMAQSRPATTTVQSPSSDGNLTISADEADTAEVVKKVSPSVVSIVTTKSGGRGYMSQAQQGAGTGIIISKDGYILTNKHVVHDMAQFEVITSEGERFTDVKFVGADPLNDIAFLKVNGVDDLPPATLGDSGTVRVGQKVVAIGNSLGQYQNTVTSGIVSGKGRPISAALDEYGMNVENLTDLLQTDAAINPGNSGGALVNVNGDLIGINTAIQSKTGYYEGYGFAVPSNLARKIVEDIKKFGLVQRGFLGIGSLDLSNDMQVAAYNQKNKSNLKVGDGVYVTEVTGKSGAEDAGIRTGDIVTKIDDTNIGSFADLSFAIGSRRPGDKVTVTYIRNGKPNTVTVTLKDQKGGTSSRSKEDLTVTEKIGSEFEPLSERVKTDYGLESGVLAKNVTEGGEMDKIGVVDNFIVMEINGKPVNSQKDVEKILNGYKGNVQVKYVDSYGRITTRGFKMP